MTIVERGIIPVVMGGMGNQMFIIVAAFIAHKYSGAPLYILQNPTEHNDHNIKGYNYNESLFKYFGTHIDELQTNLDFLRSLQYNVDHPGGFDEWSPPGPGTLMTSYYQYYPRIAPFEHDVRELLLRGLEDFRAKLGDYSDYCFLHVRRGDYLKYPDIHINQGLEYYSEALKVMGPAKIIIISDDTTWVKEQELFKNLEVFEGDELETMALMTKCTAGAICANSTFSWWGAFLGAHSLRSKIIVPKNWIGKHTVNLFPEEWIRI